MQALKRNTCKIMAIFGTAVFTIGVIGTGVSLRDLLSIGSVIIVGALVRLAIKPAMQPQIDAYREGHDAGYDLGFYEGRREARPVVVHLSDTKAHFN